MNIHNNMSAKLRADADEIIRQSIHAVLPDAAVARALTGMNFPGKIYLAAIGKAAWQMARAAVDHLPRPIESGIVITKYGHTDGDIPRCRLYEAGHPVPDQNSFAATRLRSIWSDRQGKEIPSCFWYPAAAARYLNSRWCPVKNCRISPDSCWEAAPISSK